MTTPEIDTAGIRDECEGMDGPGMNGLMSLRVDQVLGLCDALDEAEAKIERLTGDVELFRQAAHAEAGIARTMFARAEKAEAQVAAVRALGTAWVGFDGSHGYGDDILKIVGGAE